MNESSAYKLLRDKAEILLQTGKTSVTSRSGISIEVLQSLYELSSESDSAADALKLLHELQVYQVELDLQKEEMAANEQSLVEELNFYRNFFNTAPLAYFLVDHKCIIIQGNHAAAELFNTTQDDLDGRQVDSLLDPESRPALLELLQQASWSRKRSSCTAKSDGEGDASSRLLLHACNSHDNKHVLLTCCEYPTDSLA